MKKFSVKITAFIMAILIGCLSIGTFNVSAATEAGTYVVYWVERARVGQYTISHEITSNAIDMPSANSVIGDDTRVPDPNNLTVVRLSIGGTGFIVGTHTIATAAHCVVSDRTFFDDLTISIVGANGNVIKTMEPKYIHVPYQYYNALSNSIRINYDFAMIEVEEDLSEYGYFDLGTVLDDYATNAPSTTVSVSGFPQRESEDWGARYVGSGQIISQDEYRLIYNVDTSGGNSGGPIYTTISTTYGTTYKVAIGIHTRAENSGVRITSRLLQFYLYNSHKKYDLPE